MLDRSLVRFAAKGPILQSARSSRLRGACAKPEIRMGGLQSEPDRQVSGFAADKTLRRAAGELGQDAALAGELDRPCPIRLSRDRRGCPAPRPRRPAGPRARPDPSAMPNIVASAHDQARRAPEEPAGQSAGQRPKVDVGSLRPEYGRDEARAIAKTMADSEPERGTSAREIVEIEAFAGQDGQTQAARTTCTGPARGSNPSPEDRAGGDKPQATTGAWWRRRN